MLRVKAWIDRRCTFSHACLHLPWFSWARDPGDVAWFRRRAAQLEAAPHAPLPATTLNLFATALLHAGRGSRDLILTMRQHAGQCRASYGVPLALQFAQLLVALFRYNFTAQQYYRLRLFRLPRLHWAEIVEHRETTLVLTQVAKRAGVDALWTKQGWEEFGRQHRLPVVSTLFVLTGASSPDAGAYPLAPGHDYFCKPDIDFSSRGAAMLVWQEKEKGWKIRGGPGGFASASEIIETLAAYAARLGGPVVVQPCLRNHRSLNDLFPTGLINIRINTHFHTGERVEIGAAALRFPIPEHHCSDVVGGTLCVPIEVSSGLLGAGESAQLNFGEVHVHPRLGVQISGRTVPDWPEMLRLVRAAHILVPTMPLISWDVVPSDQGLFLLEANATGHGDLTQCWGKLPFGLTTAPRLLRAALLASDSAASPAR